jgi:hypothetical protein
MHARRLLLAALVALALPAAAQAPIDDALVFVAVTAERGSECGLLPPWEAEVIRAEIGMILIEAGEAARETVLADAAALGAAMPCDDVGLNAWIGGARDGILKEWLPPHLAIFRAFAAMEPPPAIFTEAAGTTDLAAAVAAIDAQFAEFEAAGIRAEGGRSWPDYQAMVAGELPAIVAAATGGATDEYGAEEATAYIRNAAAIVALWLQTQE